MPAALRRRRHGRKGNCRLKVRKADSKGLYLRPVLFYSAGSRVRQTTNPCIMIRPHIPEQTTFRLTDGLSVRGGAPNTAEPRKTVALPNRAAGRPYRRTVRRKPLYFPARRPGYRIPLPRNATTNTGNRAPFHPIFRPHFGIPDISQFESGQESSL